MGIPNRVDTSTLGWVKDEIDQSLVHAREALQRYADASEDLTALRLFANSVHQVAGTLQMVELDGAAQLAQETEALAGNLVAGHVDGSGDPAAVDLLERGLTHLSRYMEGLARGLPDKPIDNVDVINELRRARNVEPLDPFSLFHPDLDVYPVRDTSADEIDTETYTRRVRELRRDYQAALLGWLRSQDTENAWQTLADVVFGLYEISRFRASMQLWWVARAYLDALKSAELSRDDPRKHPLAKLDQLMRKLSEDGEAAIARESSDNLVRYMLYHIGRSDMRTDAVRSVVQLFELDTLLGSGEAPAVPRPDELAALREPLMEPLKSVHAALDEYERTGEAGEAFTAANANLSRVVDAAREAGVDELADLASSVHRILFTGDKPAPDAEALLASARALLFIEQTLEDPDKLSADWRQQAAAVADQLAEYSGHGEAPSLAIESHEVDADSLDKHELRRLVSAVAGQVADNLSEAEQNLEQFSRNNTDTDSLTAVVSSLQQVHGAARMLAQHKLCDLLETAVDRTRSIAEGSVYPDDALIDALAVAIGSADAYIKGLERGSANIGNVLDRATQELENASSAENLVAVDADATLRRVQECFEAWARDSSDYEAFRTLRRSLRDIGALAHHQGQLSLKQIAQEMTNLLDIVTDDPGFLSDEVRDTLQRSLSTLVELSAKLESRSGASELASEGTGAVAAVTGGEEDDDGDEIVREAFAEEARECIQAISDNLAALEQNIEDRSALVDARRGFHTIKGSGRMAKARGIAELAWVVEDMLNRCIDGDAAISPSIVAFAMEASRELDVLLKKGLDSPVDLQSWRERAAAAQAEQAGRADSGGDEPDAKTGVEHEPAQPYVEPARAAPVQGSGGHEAELALQSIEDLGEQGHKLVREEEDPEMASPFSDDEVIKIFSKEALSHIAVIRGVIDECKRRGQAPVSDELTRAVHTLQGNARSLHLVEMSEAYSRLDSALRAKEQSGSALRKAEMEWLDALLIATAKVLDHLNRDRRFPEVVRQELTDLAGRIETSWSDVRRPPAAARDSFDDLERASELVADSDDAGQGQGDNDTYSGGGPRTGDDDRGGDGASVFDELFESESAPAAESVPDAAPDGVEADAASVADAGSPEPNLDTTDAAAMDPDLKDVFLEEATDTLSRIESTLQEGRRAGMSADLGNTLKRELHTLKGSSRAAGMETIGNLSHDAETMLEGRSWDADTPVELLETFEEVHDTLANLVQGVDEDRSVEPDPALVQRLRGEAAPASAVNYDQQASGGVSLIPEEGSVSPDNDPVSSDNDKAEDAAASLAEPVREPAAGSRTGPVPEEVDSAAETPRPAGGRSTVRIQSNVLDKLVNYAGEVSISRSQLEEQLSGLKGNLNELRNNVTRFSDQIRELDIQADTQIRSRVAEETVPQVGDDFDPLEMDRYSRLQQLSRSLSESVDDLLTIQSGLNRFAVQTEGFLSQQAMLNSELQDGLMSARMVPFNTLVPRLRHQARQTARELNKDVDFAVSGGELEVDRNILDQLSEALEHMIRNSLDHGIEPAAARRAAGKPEKGSVRIDCRQEGREVVLKFSDDGAGLDVEQVKARAVEAGLLSGSSDLTDEEVIQLVVLSGFSTAASVTKLSGRGVGLDVVNDAVRRLGGSLTLENRPGEGVTFELRLPLSLSITQAMFVRCGDQRFAIPLGIIETVLKTEPENLSELSKDGDPLFKRDDRVYTLMDLTATLGLEPNPTEKRVPVLLVRMGAREVAVRVDDLVGTDEIVVKQLGDHLGRMSGINGATITGDGSVVLILDVAELWLAQERLPAFRHEVEGANAPPRVMVVDDSLTVRKVTGRNLGRHGMEVSMARDGFDALDQLANARPDVMLVDIEMPKMDGYELITRVRQDANHGDVPILVITSRAGAKHRDKAMELGANAYLTKPYQERELLDEVNALLDGARQSTVH